MKILVDKMPQKSEECLYRKYYNEVYKHWNCGFRDTTICSLDCGMECEYLLEKSIDDN